MRPAGLVALTLGALLLAPGSTAAQAIEPDASSVRTSLAPNAERPLTHEELLTVRGESPRWTHRPMTLVADATVDRDQVLRGHRCDRDVRLCSYGTLARDDGFPGDPVVSVRPGAVRRFGAEGTPMQGRFAFIRSRGNIRLIDPVASPAGTYLTPIEPESMAVAGELPVRSLVAVRGWLSVLERDEACPTVPRALDGRRDGWDSPFVRCPGGWLTAGELVEPDPDDPLRPAGFGIPVQFGALDRYGTDEPGPATYLLRRVRNPMAGREPTHAWRVAGRLDAIDDTLLPRAPDGVAGPPGLDWRPAIGRQPPADTRQIYTTSWSGGFASVHEGTDQVLSAWASPDGVDWRATELPARIRSVTGLLRLGDGLALVANEHVADESRTFETWRSADGIRWQRAGKTRITMAPRFSDYLRFINGYWSLGDRIMAVETYTQQPTGGDTVGVVVDDPGPDVTIAWISQDGERWRREKATGLGGPRTGMSSSVLVQGDGEVLLLQANDSSDLRRTTDGVRWEPIGTYPQGLIRNAPLTFGRVNDQLAIAGEPIEDTHGDGNFLTVWRGDESGGWERTLDRPSRMATTMVSSGSTLVIAGLQFDFRAIDDEFDPSFVPFVLVSIDGGEVWDASLEWAGDQRWCLGGRNWDGGLTEHDGTILLDLSCPPPGAATTYRTTVPR